MYVDPFLDPKDYFKPNESMYFGLIAARLVVEDATKLLCEILIYGQEEFFKKKGIIDFDYQDHCRELLSAVIFKLKSTTFVTEQLHAIRNAKDYRVPPETILKMEGENFDEFLHRALFDYALQQMQSLMEMYIRYITYFCNKKDYTKKVLFEAINDLGVSKSLTGKEMHRKLRSEVYHPESRIGKFYWGDVLANMRNTTTHEKLLMLSNLEVVNPLGKNRTEISFEGQSIARYTQAVMDNVLIMLRSGFKILYEIDWDEASKKLRQG